jgi:F-type H+-transporting ATPase subunit gamma
MASLRDIRKRIRSVKNSQKITKAMKLVAASKLKRAQDAIVRARPYATALGGLLARVSARAQADTDQTEAMPLHPLLVLRPPRRVLLVVITSDRGLCGAFNSNILRRAERFISENAERFEHIEIATIGRKGRDYFRKRHLAPVRDYPGIVGNLHYDQAITLAEGLVKEYTEQSLDAGFLLYNEFKSAISQQVSLRDILPVTPEAPEKAVSASAPADAQALAAPQAPADEVDYLYEPDRATVLNRLVPRYVAIEMWRALLESVASEHGARMTAMDSATRNARDLTEQLTLQYNRARQATITRELMDIVGGAEALSG